MSTTGYTATPAGWYPDPAGSARTRWWDGTQWTDTFADAAAPAPYTYAPAGPLRAPAGTSPFTPFVWLLALVPLIDVVSVIVLALNGERAAFTPMTLSSELARASTELSSGLIINAVIGWVVIGANILLAGLDWHALKTAGMPRPFHWAWGLFAIISVPVYIVGRTVIAKRRTGAGLAPLFVYIGCSLLSFIVSIVIVLVTVGPDLARAAH